MNKKDVLEKKLKQNNGLKDTFSEYEGGQDSEKAIDFIKNVKFDHFFYCDWFFFFLEIPKIRSSNWCR